MCHDCPTPRTRAKGVLREFGAAVLLPVFLYVVPVGLLLLSGDLVL
ncbi:MAG TPA: hypothetical protein VK964_15980 [Nocardioidaceae bacterium]|nr:hypothetical protein [Nocardioidaceae bacterium]